MFDLVCCPFFRTFFYLLLSYIIISLIYATIKLHNGDFFMENILSTEEIVRRLDGRVLAKVIRDVGISKHTVYRIMKGEDVYYSTVKKLSDYLIEKEKPTVR